MNKLNYKEYLNNGGILKKSNFYARRNKYELELLRLLHRGIPYLLAYGIIETKNPDLSHFISGV